MRDEVYEELNAIRPHLDFSESTALDSLIYKGQWWSDENQKGLDDCIEKANGLGYGRIAAWIMTERAMLSRN